MCLLCLAALLAEVVTGLAVFSRYNEFAESELTFRHLKKFISQKLDLTYEAISVDEYQSIIEDETDKIANRCDGGKVSPQSGIQDAVGL